MQSSNHLSKTISLASLKICIWVSGQAMSSAQSVTTLVKHQAGSKTYSYRLRMSLNRLLQTNQLKKLSISICARQLWKAIMLTPAQGVETKLPRKKEID